jgi:CysZ protein
MEEAAPELVAGRPGLLRRAAAGAWHVPAGFAFLFGNPRLWALAVLPAVVAIVCVATGAVLGLFLVPNAEATFGPTSGRFPEWVALPVSVLLAMATIGAGAFLGLGVALALAAPLLERLSRRVEALCRGAADDLSPGLGWEVSQSLRSAVYFLVAAPGVFLLGLIPLLGPLLSVLWGARAVAFQMTDPALSRRGMSFNDKRRWHRQWLAETQGFGLAGMVGLIVPFANLLLGPALVTGGTRLVLELQDAAGPRPIQAEEPGARGPA